VQLLENFCVMLKALLEARLTQMLLFLKRYLCAWGNQVNRRVAFVASLAEHCFFNRVSSRLNRMARDEASKSTRSPGTWIALRCVSECRARSS